MIRTLLLLGLAAIGVGASPAARTADVAGPAPVEFTVDTPQGARPAWLVAGPTHGHPRPIVLLLHGHGGSASQVLGYGGKLASPLAEWIAIAKRDDVAVVALEGDRGGDGRRGWDDCRSDAPSNPPADDVAYARAAVARVVREFDGDPKRVFAMGMSNGGIMMFRLAVQMPELAGFAAVSASMAASSLCPEPLPAHVSVLLISGDADPLVPWGGGDVRLGQREGRGSVIGALRTFARWVEAHRLDPASAHVAALPPRLPDDATKANVRYFGDAVATSPVVLVQVQGGGHVEPSLRQRYGALYLAVVGAQSSVFESADFAWAFFAAQPAVVR